MNILVTGSNGFIGQNICVELETLHHNVLKFTSSNTEEELSELVKEADFVMHLAGINRTANSEDFYNGNSKFTMDLLALLEKQQRNIPVLFSSSIQVSKDNDYGKSKKMAEDAVFDYGKRTKSNIYIFRLANAFGKWCKPNYNSVVATFCHQIANDLPIEINTTNEVVPFVYIDDIVHDFIKCLDGCKRNELLEVQPVYKITVQQLAQQLLHFKSSRNNNMLPDLTEEFTKKLYSTYLTYLPETGFSTLLKMNADERGSVTEFLKTDGFGQVLVNIIEPGNTKGNHWHHTKNEKFLVVSGSGIIRFRRIGSSEIVEYKVDGTKLQVIDSPPGFVHNIENLGNDKLITMIWCNELFDPNQPDTFFEKV